MITLEDVRSFKLYPWNVSGPLPPDPCQPVVPHPSHEMRGKCDSSMAGHFITACTRCGVRLGAMTDDGRNKIEQVCNAVPVSS